MNQAVFVSAPVRHVKDFGLECVLIAFLAGWAVIVLGRPMEYEVRADLALASHEPDAVSGRHASAAPANVSEQLTLHFIEAAKRNSEVRANTRAVSEPFAVAVVNDRRIAVICRAIGAAAAKRNCAWVVTNTLANLNALQPAGTTMRRLGPARLGISGLLLMAAIAIGLGCGLAWGVLRAAIENSEWLRERQLARVRMEFRERHSAPEWTAVRPSGRSPTGRATRPRASVPQESLRRTSVPPPPPSRRSHNGALVSRPRASVPPPFPNEARASVPAPRPASPDDRQRVDAGERPSERLDAEAAVAERRSPPPTAAEAFETSDRPAGATASPLPSAAEDPARPKTDRLSPPPTAASEQPNAADDEGPNTPRPAHLQSPASATEQPSPPLGTFRQSAPPPKPNDDPEARARQSTRPERPNAAPRPSAPPSAQEPTPRRSAPPPAPELMPRRSAPPPAPEPMPRRSAPPPAPELMPRRSAPPPAPELMPRSQPMAAEAGSADRDPPQPSAAADSSAEARTRQSTPPERPSRTRRLSAPPPPPATLLAPKPNLPLTAAGQVAAGLATPANELSPRQLMDARWATLVSASRSPDPTPAEALRPARRATLIGTPYSAQAAEPARRTILIDSPTGRGLVSAPDFPAPVESLPMVLESLQPSAAEASLPLRSPGTPPPLPTASDRPSASPVAAAPAVEPPPFDSPFANASAEVVPFAVFAETAAEADPAPAPTEFTPGAPAEPVGERPITTSTLTSLDVPTPAPREELQELCYELLESSANGCFIVRVSSPPASKRIKTQLAVQLAWTLAAPGRARVLLVEGDFDEPALHDVLRLKPPPFEGFSQQLNRRMLAGATPLPWTVLRCAPGLNALVEGRVRTPGLLDSSAFALALEEQRQHYDIIIADGPPMNGSDGRCSMDGLTDGVVVAVAASEPNFGEHMFDDERLWILHTQT
jgi:hypothetical protein